MDLRNGHWDVAGGHAVTRVVAAYRLQTAPPALGKPLEGERRNCANLPGQCIPCTLGCVCPAMGRGRLVFPIQAASHSLRRKRDDRVGSGIWNARRAGHARHRPCSGARHIRAREGVAHLTKGPHPTPQGRERLFELLAPNPPWPPLNGGEEETGRDGVRGAGDGPRGPRRHLASGGVREEGKA
jgi:hypothetical protein